MILMKEKVKIGYVGFGRRGFGIIKYALVDMKDVEISALCEIDPDKAEAATRLLTENGRPAPKLYTDYNEMLENPEIDAIYVAVPNHLHYEMSLKASFCPHCGCSSELALENLFLPRTLTFIEDNAFRNCTSLKNVILPDTITDIGVSAFWGCTNLESIAIAPSVNRIGAAAFMECTNLKRIGIPPSVTRIDQAAFSQCTSLETIFISDSVEYIGSCAFMGCSNLEAIVIPDSVTYLGDYAFRGCVNLKYVQLSSSLSSIKAHTFNGCSLDRLVIPQSVKEVDRQAFDGMDILGEFLIPKHLENSVNFLFRSHIKTY